jgi:hypothetical protein
MSPETLEFNSADELTELIRNINMKYYPRLTANICYLEEYDDSIFFVYLVTLKDAYSHLVRVFDYDIKLPIGKNNARNHLLQYIDHLQEGLMDTFRKIVELEWKSVKGSIPEKELNVIGFQVAQKASQLRIMNVDVTIDDRIEGYKSLLGYLDDVRKKFST